MTTTYKRTFGVLRTPTPQAGNRAPVNLNTENKHRKIWQQ